jgi:valyl-tRNA synthetase
LNLSDYAPAPLADSELTVEDRWLLSRLASVTATVTEALESYRYSEAARTLYDFAWDDFCSFFVEMAKERLRSPELRPAAQRVLVHALDQLLRLLHPMIPYVTEEVWGLLNQAAGVRGLRDPAAASKSLMTTAWPEADPARRDEQIEARFAQFQAALSGLREIRSRQSISPKKRIEFRVRCDEETADLLKPMAPYFRSLAAAKGTAWGAQVQPPSQHEKFNVRNMEIYVDLRGFIDVKAAIARNEKQLQKLLQLIQNKESKLANARYVQRAPAEVVQRDRESLRQLRDEADSVRHTLEQQRRLSQQTGQ